MTRTFSIITATVGAALVFAVPAWADNWGADQQSPQVHVSPDLEDRATTVDRDRLSAMLDAREQSLGAGVGNGKVSAVDARERSFGAKQVATPAPDWFERAADKATRDYRVPVVDDRFRIDPTSGPGTGTVSSGRDLELPQIGIGLGIGLALALGLFVALRYTRTRPLAH